MVVESNPRSDGGLCLRPGLPSVQVDAFVFQGLPQALDEDIADAPPLAGLWTFRKLPWRKGCRPKRDQTHPRAVYLC